MEVESKSVTLRGWDAVLGMAGVLLSWAGTALLIAVRPQSYRYLAAR